MKGWRSGVAGGGEQFIEVRMTVKNRWDGAAEECVVGDCCRKGGLMGWRGTRGETRPVSRLRAPKAQRPWMPRVSPLTGEMGLKHRLFHHQTLPVFSEEYPSSSTHSPVRVWGEKCTRYNKEGTWHGTWGFECRLLHTLSRIRLFPASAVNFQSWCAVNRIFEASSHCWGTRAIECVFCLLSIWKQQPLLCMNTWISWSSIWIFLLIPAVYPPHSDRTDKADLLSGLIRWSVTLAIKALLEI